jgi:hypothetical protein
MFHLATTLCEGEGTPRMVTTLDTNPTWSMVSHGTFNVNYVKIFKTLFWHVAFVKFLKLPTHSTIGRASVSHSVVVVHNEEGAF